MYDIVSVLFVLSFFGLCVAYANACDRILGPDELVAADETSPERSGPDEAVAA